MPKIKSSKYRLKKNRDKEKKRLNRLSQSIKILKPKVTMRELRKVKEFVIKEKLRNANKMRIIRANTNYKEIENLRMKSKIISYRRNLIFKEHEKETTKKNERNSTKIFL